MKIRGRKRLERRRLHRMAQAWGRTFARRLRKGRKGKLRRLTRSWGRSRNPRRRITKAQLSALEEAALVGALRPGRLRFLASGTRAPESNHTSITSGVRTSFFPSSSSST
jgi:hypothetical protein